MGEEIEQGSHPKNAEQDLEDAGQQGQEDDAGIKPLGMLGGQRSNTGGGQQRGHGDRARGKLAGRSEDGADNGGNQGGIESIIGRHPGQSGIGEGLRDGNQCHRDACEQVGFK